MKEKLEKLEFLYDLDPNKPLMKYGEEKDKKNPFADILREQNKKGGDSAYFHSFRAQNPVQQIDSGDFKRTTTGLYF